MWNWIQGEFYTFLMVLERYPKVWILPCIFFFLCFGLLAWFKSQLEHYLEIRTVTFMTSFMDQFITNFYDKIRGKIVSRYLLLGTLVLFFIGYSKYRKKVYY